MRLFTLLILVFFTSFLTFKGKKYVFSEIIFLATGLIAGQFIKGLDRDIYTFFELSLLGFFGIVYGMSIDISRIVRMYYTSVRKAIIEVFLGIFFFLLISVVFHSRIMLTEKFAILVFILTGAAPYFVDTTSREQVVTSFFLPAIVTVIVGIIHFHPLSFLMLTLILVIVAYVMRFAFDKAGDIITSLSVILGSAIIMPYIALRYNESPFFYAFLLGAIMINILKSRKIMDFMLDFKEDEKMFFLVFLFIVGLSTKVNFKMILYALAIYFIKIIFKSTVAKLVHSSRNVSYYIAQGAIGLVLMVDILGPGNLLGGVGGTLVMAYFFNLLFITAISLKERRI